MQVPDSAATSVPNSGPWGGSARGERRAQRTEQELERWDQAVAAARQAKAEAERALLDALKQGRTAKIRIGGQRVSAAMARELLAVAEHDLRVASRRRDAAARQR